MTAAASGLSVCDFAVSVLLLLAKTLFAEAMGSDGRVRITGKKRPAFERRGELVETRRTTWAVAQLKHRHTPVPMTGPPHFQASPLGLKKERRPRVFVRFCTRMQLNSNANCHQ